MTVGSEAKEGWWTMVPIVRWFGQAGVWVVEQVVLVSKSQGLAVWLEVLTV